MSDSIQVAFKLPQRDLSEIDELVPREFPSRAEALRHAVNVWLRQRREGAIDTALEKGYAALPQEASERALAELSVEALADAELDW